MRAKTIIGNLVKGKKKMGVLLGVFLVVSLSTTYAIHLSDQDREIERDQDLETEHSFPPLILPKPAANGFVQTPDEYILDTPFPEVGSDAMVYICNIKVTEAEANIIKESLGISGPLYENETMFCANEGSLVLHIYKFSGAVLYADGDRLFNETNPTLPDDSVAIDIANNFLISHGLKPSGVFDANAERSTLTYHDPSDGTNTTVETDVHVHYTRLIDDTYVYGPGSVVKVSIGDNDDVVGLWRTWRPWEAYIRQPIILPEEAYVTMQGEGINTHLQNVTTAVVNNIILGYWADPGIVEQTYLQPVYMFSGDAYNAEGETEPFTAFVAALE